MRRFTTCAALVLAASAALCSKALGWGYYNWYGGYSSATATGWNGGGSASWDYAPGSWGWGWGGSCSAYAYTNTYPSVDYRYSYGWAGASATAHSQASSPTRSADATATAYNANWGWWNYGGYSRAQASTNGSPSYAVARANTNSNWWFNYRVPYLWYYNTWRPIWGGNVPFRFDYYQWGWLDGDTPDMAVGAILSANDGTQTTSLINSYFKDNGDGTFTLNGTDFNSADMVYNPDVGGIGHAGWDYLGHDGSQDQSAIAKYFLANASVTGENMGEGWVDLRVEYSVDGMIGGVPEPTAALSMLGGSLLLLIRKREKRSH